MNKETILIISAVIGAPFIGVLITSIFNKRKAGAETHNINIGGEISVGDYGLRVADRTEASNARLEKKVEELEIKMSKLLESYKELQMQREEMYKQSVILDDENRVKDIKIQKLEMRVNTLEKELERYHVMEKNIKNVDVHAKVDSIVEDIKQEVIK